MQFQNDDGQRKNIMVTKIVIEAIIYTLLYTVFMLILSKIQGATYQLYNYPPAIRERAIEKGDHYREGTG